MFVGLFIHFLKVLQRLACVCMDHATCVLCTENNLVVFIKLALPLSELMHDMWKMTGKTAKSGCG